ncbi:MAG: universal stress protein [Proteobacteria bacterium]|nr:universal stress protein [Pseudomonadota bacterium]
MEVRRILVPVDFSRQSDAVLKWAADLASEHRSVVILLHTLQLPIEFQQLEGAYLPPDFWSDARREAATTLHELAEGLRSRHQLQVEELVREGETATVIEEEAARQHADLIVIGSRGLRGLRHLLLGSTAERVVNRAPCPVLTVKTCGGETTIAPLPDTESGDPSTHTRQ